MKQAILIHSYNIERDKAILEKYSTVNEHKYYKEISMTSDNGRWYLFIVEQNDWSKICKRHKINHRNTFSEAKTRPFFVKVTKCSPFCYDANKKLIGKTMQVMIDPVNNQYFSICPPLPIQKLCHSDGNYSRDGYVYGVLIHDCVRVNSKNEKIIKSEWGKIKRGVTKKMPVGITLKDIQKLRAILEK